jgi:hypothetical protein
LCGGVCGMVLNGENLWPDRVGILAVAACSLVVWVVCVDVKESKTDNQMWPITCKCLCLKGSLGLYIWVVP